MHGVQVRLEKEETEEKISLGGDKWRTLPMHAVLDKAGLSAGGRVDTRPWEAHLQLGSWAEAGVPLP